MGFASLVQTFFPWSAESMGRFRFGEFSQRVIQGDFQACRRPDTVRLSRGICAADRSVGDPKKEELYEHGQCAHRFTEPLTELQQLLLRLLDLAPGIYG